MVGPVLHHEMLLGSRRSRQYIFRWIYAGWLVIELSVLYAVYRIEYWSAAAPMPFGNGRPDPNATARFAVGFLTLFLNQQMILLTLATPILTAGAVTEEKTRRTLQYLLATDLNSWHIIIGKYLGRLAQVLLLVLTGLPVVCFVGVFGGLEPLALLAVLAITLLHVTALGAASLLSSVWSKNTVEAVLALYAVTSPLILVIGLGWLFGWDLGLLDPRYVLDAATGGHSAADLQELLRRLMQVSVLFGGPALVCLALAIWRLRPAYIRQIEGKVRSDKHRWWRAARAAVGDNPLHWKERYVEGMAPLAVLRSVPAWLMLLLVFSATTALSGAILAMYLPSNFTFNEAFRLLLELKFADLWALVAPSVPAGFVPPATFFFLEGLLAMLGASFVVGIRCSGAISGERERQSWEALLLTPLSSRQLIRGKLWGIIGASYIYLIAYAVPALALSALGGVMSFFWIALWLAVTWLAMYFVGATGIWCSVRSQSSWRSLLMTVGIGYLGGLLVYAITSPVILILAFMILLMLMVVDYYLGTGMSAAAIGGGDRFLDAFQIASCIGLAILFWLLALFFVNDSQKWVADRERTRHWKDEPLRLRPQPRMARPRFYR